MHSNELRALADDVDEILVRHTLRPWYSRVVEHGGESFVQDLDAAWGPMAPTARSAVMHARHVWTLATLARLRPDLESVAGGSKGDWEAWAVTGLESMHARFGTGVPGGIAFVEGRTAQTHSYAVAFALYAAAAVTRLTGDARHRDIGRAITTWLEAAWRDTDGAYAEALDATGAPLAPDPKRPIDLLGIPAGARSTNTALHLIEAFSEWSAAGAADVDERLLRLLHGFETRISRSGGRLYHTYDRYGRPLDRTRSFGHDVESFHLCARARSRLARPSATPTEALARRALREGWDRRHGGLMYTRGPARWRWAREKVWWVQAESLLALATLAERETGPDRDATLSRLREQWTFVKRHQLDPDHDGWIDTVSRSASEVLAAPKAHPWKACYHEVRALVGTAALLRRLAG